MPYFMNPTPWPVMEEHDDRDFRYMNMLPDEILLMSGRQAEVNRQRAIAEYGSEPVSLPTAAIKEEGGGGRQGHKFLDYAVYISSALLVIGVIFLIKKKLL